MSIVKAIEGGKVPDMLECLEWARERIASGRAASMAVVFVESNERDSNYISLKHHTHDRHQLIGMLFRATQLAGEE